MQSTCSALAPRHSVPRTDATWVRLLSLYLSALVSACDSDAANTERVADAGAPPGTHELPRYDSLGNLWEWCQDWLGPYDVGPATDPQGPVTGEGRVIRGGSRSNYAAEMRVANRNQGTPVDKVIILGFRIAREPDESP